MADERLSPELLAHWETFPDVLPRRAAQQLTGEIRTLQARITALEGALRTALQWWWWHTGETPGRDEKAEYDELKAVLEGGT